jgi:hypothetical protein
MSGATMPGRDREPGTGGRIETSAIGDSDRLPLIRPMLAVLRDALPDDDAAWGYEFKWDGVRAVAYLAGDHVRLLSRNDRDMTGSYPELVDPLRTHRSGGVVVDGELVAVAGGRPSFAALQHRMHVRRPDPGLVAATPVTYMVFDVLHLDGRSTLTLPYRERRGLLEGLRFAGGRVEIPPYYAGGGAQVLAASGDGGLEGVVAKRLDAAYHPGRRSPVWLKVKNFRTQEVVLGMDARQGAPREPDRLAAARHPRAGWPGVLRSGGDGLHRGDPRRPAGAVGSAGGGAEPVRGSAARGVRPDRAVGPAGARGRGPFLGVDRRRPAATPVLARAPPGQVTRRRDEGVLTPRHTVRDRRGCARRRAGARRGRRPVR